jgi:heterogeneous nuclear ribonucleoprotein F/H
VVVRLRGLPYNATMSDISAFFSGFDIIPNGIHLVVGRDGRSTGEGYAEFSSEDQADAAIKAKHREKIGSR